MTRSKVSTPPTRISRKIGAYLWRYPNPDQAPSYQQSPVYLLLSTIASTTAITICVPDDLNLEAAILKAARSLTKTLPFELMTLVCSSC